jgi:hypothetical protein
MGLLDNAVNKSVPQGSSLAKPVNAGAIMHRLAGAKIHQRC